MTDRILDISEEPARLSVRLEQLVIERDGVDNVTVPIAEIAAVAVSNPAVSFTHAALSKLASAGVCLVVCNEKHLPVGMMLPIMGHSTQTERFAQQAEASLPTRKRLWQQIVRAKVEAQGRALAELRGKDFGLIAMSKTVKSGDSENVEAQASRIYWQHLFGDDGFVRKRDAEDQNRHLNYGYAVLRAIVARALCASGLHPSIGIHHHTRYDAFCLADDLMEPFRPLVDRAVARMVAERGVDIPMDREAKAALIEAITGRFVLDEESRTLFDILSRVASSLAAVFSGQREELLLPEV